MRRSLATFAFAFVVALGVLAAPVGPAPLAPAAAAEDTTTTSTTTAPRPGGDIIPQPNSGQEPEDPGDRGGSLQTALFFGLIVAVVAAVAVLVRQSRKARAERGF